MFKKIILEDLPTKEAIRTHPDTERHNKIPNKFYRFLRSKVGQKWDHIFSEIVIKFPEFIKIDPNFVECGVEFNCKKIDGIIYNSRGYQVGDHYGGWEHYYVTQDGILHTSKQRKYKRPQQKQKIVTYGGKQYFCYEDIWYEVETAPLNKIRPYFTFCDYGYDVFLGRIWNNYTTYNLYGQFIRCLSKRQINKREKKRIEKHLNDNQHS